MSARILFVEKDDQLRLRIGEALGQENVEPGGLFSLLNSIGVRAIVHFVYSISQGARAADSACIQPSRCCFQSRLGADDELVIL